MALSSLKTIYWRWALRVTFLSDGARQVDLAGKTLMPGYIDAHAHGPYARDDIILK